MTLIPRTRVRKVHGLAPDDVAQVEAFLQGAVYAWIAENGDRPFSARDLVGGVNADWAGTRLMPLFRKHERTKPELAAVRAAGVDLGWILKSVLDRDKRDFERRRRYVASYKWLDSHKT